MTKYLDSDGLSHLVGKIKETDNDIVSRIDALAEEMVSAGLKGTLPIASGGTGLTSSPSMLTNLATTSAADILQEEPRPGVTGTLPIANGGTGLTASPSMLTNLATTSAANVMQSSPRPGVTGTLPIANGGTGSTSASGAVSNMKSALVNLIYPVGAVYISYISTSPASLFGGTWTAITGRFPYFNAGTGTGGSNTHSHWETVGLDWSPGTLYVTDGAKYTSTRVVTGNAHTYAYENWGENINLRQSATYAASSMPAYQTLYAWRRTA